jgi:hypothetical protein
MRTGELRDITPLLTYGYQVRIGEYVSRGWDLLQPKLGIFVGYILVLFGINLAISLVSAALSPVFGNYWIFVGWFVTSILCILSCPLHAGIFIVAHRLLLEEPVEFGDFFKGRFFQRI